MFICRDYALFLQINFNFNIVLQNNFNNKPGPDIMNVNHKIHIR